MLEKDPQSRTVEYIHIMFWTMMDEKKKIFSQMKCISSKTSQGCFLLFYVRQAQAVGGASELALGEVKFKLVLLLLN